VALSLYGDAATLVKAVTYPEIADVNQPAESLSITATLVILQPILKQLTWS